MDHARAVRRVEAGQHLRDDVRGTVGRDPSFAVDDPREGLATQPLHHVEGQVAAVVVEELDRDEVGMAEAGGHLGFSAKAFQVRGMAGELRLQHLDGHGPLRSEVGALVDAAHAAAPEEVAEDVSPGQRPAGHGSEEGHRASRKVSFCA